MKVKILKEDGYKEAMLGLSLSYGTDKEKAESTAIRLYTKDGGHNKFLESIVVWLDITAPRYFWQQFDTYRIGVTKQSESTMHTILKRELTQLDFEDPIKPIILSNLNDRIQKKEFDQIKNELPEGFLQRRIICTNIKTLRNIIAQRKHHKLALWQQFCAEIFAQTNYPEFYRDLSETIQ